VQEKKYTELFNVKDKGGEINEFIKSNDVSPLLVSPVTGNRAVYEAVKVLRQTGLLDENKYKTTRKGKQLLKKLGNKWPAYIPIENGKVIPEKAIYIPE